MLHLKNQKYLLFSVLSSYLSVFLPLNCHFSFLILLGFLLLSVKKCSSVLIYLLYNEKAGLCVNNPSNRTFFICVCIIIDWMKVIFVLCLRCFIFPALHPYFKPANSIVKRDACNMISKCLWSPVWRPLSPTFDSLLCFYLFYALQFLFFTSEVKKKNVTLCQCMYSWLKISFVSFEESQTCT